MYTLVYTLVRVCIYTGVRIYKHWCVCIYTLGCVPVHAGVCVHAHWGACICTLGCVYVRTGVCVDAQWGVYIYTLVRVYVHTGVCIYAHWGVDIYALVCVYIYKLECIYTHTGECIYTGWGVYMYTRIGVVYLYTLFFFVYAHWDVCRRFTNALQDGNVCSKSWATIRNMTLYDGGTDRNQYLNCLKEVSVFKVLRSPSVFLNVYCAGMHLSPHLVDKSSQIVFMKDIRQNIRI